MNRSDAFLKSTLSPIRDSYLAHMFKELRQLRNDDRNVTTELVARDETGAVLRDGVLNLPHRSDFSFDALIGTTRRNTKDTEGLDFEPIELSLDDGVFLSLHPFPWNKLSLSFDADDDTKRLVRLRLWFLEWFQARHSEKSDDLSGVVHSIDGPRKIGNTWNVTIDLGSAPTDAFVELVHVLASRGAKNIAFGTELNAAGEGLTKP